MKKGRTDGQCIRCRKTSFRSYGSANRTAAKLPQPGRAYWCAFAGAYHVTHLDEIEYQRKRAGVE